MEKRCFLLVALFVSIVVRAQWNVSMEGQYLLKHVNSGLYLYLHDNYKEGKASNTTTLRSVGTPFVLTQDGSGYTITKAGSDKTLGCATVRGLVGTRRTAWRRLGSLSMPETVPTTSSRPKVFSDRIRVPTTLVRTSTPTNKNNNIQNGWLSRKMPSPSRLPTARFMHSTTPTPTETIL